MVDLTDSGKQRLETSIIAGTLVILAVAIRFWCKLSLKSPVNSEDWWILAAIPVYLGAVADDIWGLYRGISGENQEQIIATLLQNPSPELILALETYLKVYQPGQQSASYTDGILWTHIHGLIAVFCANIPVYRPLMTKVTSFFAAILSLGSSFRSSSDDTRERTGDSTEYFQSNFDSKPMAPGPSFNKQKHPDNVSGDGRYSVPTNSGGITSVSANGGDKRLDPLTCYELTVPTVADQA
ncbi:hypothetical protein NPX13_g1446 [Xylaria arbuscula]|uniref:Uncharacterized protein n=1 Tax=Xylaria arbuscula TaxID=114810 RepID=A0A9W8NL27_9PEZI|nr:hypothetical protein NPX13_g1446 [Xylaria arbuscula]